MKIKEHTKLNSFQPIELTITIESENELINLWHRLNISNSTLKTTADLHNCRFAESEHVVFWQVINKYVEHLKKLKN